MRLIFWPPGVYGQLAFYGGSLKTLEGFREGTTQICLENEDVRGGGIAQVIKSY